MEMVSPGPGRPAGMLGATRGSSSAGRPIQKSSPSGVATSSRKKVPSDDEARGRGAARVVDVMARGMRYVAKSGAYRTFVERDPQKALRIVAWKDGLVQQRTIRLHQDLLEEEVRRGALTLPVDVHTMAYALVRVVESFFYADAIAGEKPDLEKAEEILKLMLR
jgi:hypothetical protein